jgi:hypothetical protein
MSKSNPAHRPSRKSPFDSDAARAKMLLIKREEKYRDSRDGRGAGKLQQFAPMFNTSNECKQAKCDQFEDQCLMRFNDFKSEGEERFTYCRSISTPSRSSFKANYGQANKEIEKSLKMKNRREGDVRWGEHASDGIVVGLRQAVILDCNRVLNHHNKFEVCWIEVLRLAPFKLKSQAMTSLLNYPLKHPPPCLYLRMQ